MNELTAHHIAVACGARIDRATACAAGLNMAMHAFDINTPARRGMFLANVGHETGGLRWLTEIWGPTPQQLRYERNPQQPWPRSADEAKLPFYAANRLAFSLGNYEKGDGSLFRGHGMWQTTGRFNHARTRDQLRHRFPMMNVPDFEVSPHLLADPRWASLAAGDYAETMNLNAVADAGDFDSYCDLINRGRRTAAEGDANGYEHRVALWNRIDQGRALA